MAATTAKSTNEEASQDEATKPVEEVPAVEEWSGWVPSLQGAYQPKNTVL